MTVENLNITVKTNADKAAPKLESLASAIDKLEVSVSKMAGLSNLANLASAVAQLSTSKVSVSIFNSMAKGIERLSEALATITEGDIVNLTMISDALAKLNGVNLSGVAGAARVVGKETNKAANGIKEVGDAAKKSEKPLGNFLSSLKRIAFYRIIRGIIKSITQAFQEGLEKAYLFSAAASDVMDRRFAAAMDSMKSSANAMKVQLGSAFISLLTTLEPIISKIIDLVIKVADVISQVFAAFTGTSYVKANKVATQFVDTMKSGGRAAKEWKNQLLGFDEINRLNEPNQGGGGGGTNPLDGFGGKLTEIDDWAKKLHNNLALIETVASAFLLGLGLILTFTGANIPLGLGLIAIGAVGLAHAATENWGLVDKKVADVLHSIMFVAGTAMLAIGLVLAFSGNLPLGIGLMAAGAASLAGAATIQKGLDGEINGELKKISQIAAMAMFAIGLIFALTGNLPLGLGLMGASIVAYATTLDWDAMLNGLKSAWGKIVSWYHDKVEVFFTKEWWQAKVNAAAPSWDWIVSGFRDFGNEVASIITGLFQPLADLCAWIDSALQGFGLLNEVNSPTYNVWEDPTMWTSNFASGGFPSEGQLFVANEAGPELVGTMGGRTAVANSDSIVEGIRQGVYEAVSAANNNGGGDVQVRVYLDSREIKAGQQRLNRAWGV